MAEINIKDFILEKYSDVLAPEPYIDIIFENELAVPTNDHGQERCKNLTYPFACSPLLKVPIKHYKILSEANVDGTQNKNVMELTLNIGNTTGIGIDWMPGDTIGVIPSNSEEDVTNLLYYLDLNNKADRKCHIKVNPHSKKKMGKVPNYIPSPCTPREILRDCLNLKSVLKKQFLNCLSNFCSDINEKSFLKCLSSKEGSSLYNDLVIQKCFTILDLFRACPTCKPPLNLLIEYLGRLLPRPYSIANSPLTNSKEINIIFSILNKNPGVTTNMLTKKANEEGSSILMYLRQPTLFRYCDEDISKNQIFIAVGTGISPFLGFLQHKEHLKNNGLQSGVSFLFLGATTEKASLYRQQLMKWRSENILNKFVETYSRSTSSKNKYVQDALIESSDEVVNILMQHQTVLYLCADGGEISSCIAKTIENIIVKELLVSQTDASQILKEFRANGKYREDLWV